MSRRLIAGLAAGLVALLGAVLLITYVNAADERAMANLDPVEVLVASGPIGQGTAAEDLATLVAVEEIPSAAVGPAPVRSLAELEGLVAATDIQPGEQLLAGRFVSPLDMQKFGGIPVPEGLHQVTLPFDSARVVGGTITPGDLVGVFISIDGRTHLALDKILVTRVQGGLTPSSAGSPSSNGTDGEASASASDDPSAAPVHEGNAMVTLVVNARDAETLVFAAENGSIWLTIVDPATPTGGTRIVDPGNVYE
ncbi:Flp pilus assembly protein CpaB [uncultured Dietzia sp.]|uniref:Flp pilus assembly protein CpaB n=1 Tax=uncultured Dietzia sp. TaxID=395519 RepID=UPI0025CE22D6|nr:RcpC/CpaB family pilus assembly protein [uncultured Dietzia sp.]